MFRAGFLRSKVRPCRVIRSISKTCENKDKFVKKIKEKRLILKLNYEVRRNNLEEKIDKLKKNSRRKEGGEINRSKIIKTHN